MKTWLQDVTWQHELMLDNRSFRWGRVGDDYVGEWAHLLTVRIDSNGIVKALLAVPGAPPGIVTKVAKGEAAAFARAIGGRGASLHASAVSFGPRAVIVTGASGAGKSTLASHLCTESGASLLADDVVAIDTDRATLHVEPSEDRVWLDQGMGSKGSIPLRAATEPTELTLFVALSFDDELETVRIRRLRGATMAICFLDALLRFDPTPALWTQEFDLLNRLSIGVTMIDLVRPRRVSAEVSAECVAVIAQQYPHELALVQRGAL